MSEHDTIRHGETVESFLKTEAWKFTKDKLKASLADEFFAARSPEAATKVWQKMQVVEDVDSALNTVFNQGFTARKVKEATEKAKKK